MNVSQFLKLNIFMVVNILMTGQHNLSDEYLVLVSFVQSHSEPTCVFSASPRCWALELTWTRGICRTMPSKREKFEATNVAYWLITMAHYKTQLPRLELWYMRTHQHLLCPLWESNLLCPVISQTLWSFRRIVMGKKKLKECFDNEFFGTNYAFTDHDLPKIYQMFSEVLDWENSQGSAR